jgi:hypothetical protein
MQLIVVLERTSAGPTTIRYLMRAAVPSARQAYCANPTLQSAYPATPAGDLTALRAGQYVESAVVEEFPGLNVAQIQAALVARQATYQAAITAGGSSNPYQYYGTSWDGSTWTPGGAS